MLIGSASGVGPTLDPSVLTARCRERGLSEQEFGRPEFLRVDPPTGTAGANRDLVPAPYRRCYDSWVGVARNHFTLMNIVIAVLVGAVVVFGIGLLVGRRGVAAASAALVFGGISAGLLLTTQILGLQAIYGTLYRHVAFMTAVLAIGLCTGLAVGSTLDGRSQNQYIALAGTLGVGMILALLHPPILRRMAVQGDTWWLANLRITLPLLAAGVGFLPAFSLGASGGLIAAPEALFLTLVSAAAGLLIGAVVLASGMGITFPCDVAVTLSAAGASVVIISMQL